MKPARKAPASVKPKKPVAQRAKVDPYPYLKLPKAKPTRPRAKY